MDEGFDPYRVWLGVHEPNRPPNHYQLLRLAFFEDDPEVVAHASERQISYVRSLAVGQHQELSQRILNELAAARVCLLNPTRKAVYDSQLRAAVNAETMARTTAAIAGKPLVSPHIIPSGPLQALPDASPVSPPVAGIIPSFEPRKVRLRARPNLTQSLAIGAIVAICSTGLVVLVSQVQTSNRVAPSTTSAARETRPEEDTEIVVNEFRWTGGKPERIVEVSKAFAILSRIDGAMDGYGEQARVHAAADGFWWLEGQSQQPSFRTGALAIRTKFHDFFAPSVLEYKWTPGSPPKRLLAQRDGVCMLSGVSGQFLGGGEEIRVSLKSDGYWYLSGNAASPVSGRAIAWTFRRPEFVTVEVRSYTWRAGMGAIKIIHKSQGICFLSAIGGAFEGGGEGVKLDVRPDGYWHLSGRSSQPTVRATATSVQFLVHGQARAQRP